MKTWLKPVLCAGIIASGSMAVSDQHVLANEIVDAEIVSEEDGYEFYSSQPFLKERLTENFEQQMATYAVVMNNGTVQGIELPKNVYSKYLRQNPTENPDAAKGWEIRVYMKHNISLQRKAVFFDGRGKQIGTQMFTIEK